MVSKTDPIENTSMSTNKGPKISFGDFIEITAGQINTVVDQELPLDFMHAQRKYFGIGDDIDINSNSKEIENNFLYNIPNIICYLYEEIGDTTRPLIIALGRLYQKQTGEYFLSRNWDSMERFPVKKLKQEITDRELDDDYMIYLFGNKYYFKYLKNDGKHVYKNSPGTLLKKSSLYRRKVLDHLDSVLYIPQAEYVRKLVENQLETMSDIEMVSDKDFIDFLIQKANEDIKEKQIVDQIKKEKGQKIEDDEKTQQLLMQLESINQKELSGTTQSVVDASKVQEYYTKIREAQDMFDVHGEAHIESELIHHVFTRLIRYHKSDTQNYSEAGIPKNFQQTEEYTCFSGTWLMASVLLTYGLDRDRIFFMDSIEGSGANIYKHAYLLYKKANGDYIKIDYAFGQTYNTINFDESVQKLEYGLERTFYHQDRPDNDYAGYMYRLTDGITLTYLVSVMGTLFETGDYLGVMQIGNVAKSIDKHAYHIYELQGLAQEYLGNKDESISLFQKCLNCNNICATAIFKVGEYEYKRGNIAESLKHLTLFTKIAKRGWKIDQTYITRTEAYLEEISGKEKEIGDRIEDFMKFYGPAGSLIKRDEFGKEYSKFDNQGRRNIFHKICQFFVNEKGDLSTISFAMIFMCLRYEEKKKTPIYATLRKELQDGLKTIGQG